MNKIKNEILIRFILQNGVSRGCNSLLHVTCMSIGLNYFVMNYIGKIYADFHNDKKFIKCHLAKLLWKPQMIVGGYRQLHIIASPGTDPQ